MTLRNCVKKQIFVVLSHYVLRIICYKITDNYGSIPLSTVLLSTVLVIRAVLQSKDIKWKILEINNS